MNPRILPEQAERVETGPIVFGDDWPGLFLRGDHCFGYAMQLRELLSNPGNVPLAKRFVESLIRRLESPIMHPPGKT